jgi:hypothetical protein
VPSAATQAAAVPASAPQAPLVHKPEAATVTPLPTALPPRPNIAPPPAAPVKPQSGATANDPADLPAVPKSAET